MLPRLNEEYTLFNVPKIYIKHLDMAQGRRDILMLVVYGMNSEDQ